MRGQGSEQRGREVDGRPADATGDTTRAAEAGEGAGPDSKKLELHIQEAERQGGGMRLDSRAESSGERHTAGQPGHISGGTLRHKVLLRSRCRCSPEQDERE
ncbi:hypothetical protein NDU88_003158 [Pleurodeles waltl]|uniref:Uncharacterized protein n=1 Tax=Pleurodeles waltl TaxID=8319 RepID=A0AAV7RGL6_PLEWA|nr:hypothetical protein NDU88_003158 [Pleurodeles waltl]